MCMKAIELSQLNKRYPPQHQALDHLSLTIQEGDFFGLLGPNGAGKSTTLGILTGLVRKDSGQVRVMGVDWDSDPQKAKSLLGVVPQDFNFNGFEQVEDILFHQAGYYGRSRSSVAQHVTFLLERLGLAHKRYQNARSLSGGMRRRLLIARGLVHQPRILLLDEPTAGVDVLLRHTLWDFLQELNRSGITIVLTTHYLEEAEKLCRHVGFLHEGRLVKTLDRAALQKEKLPMSVALVLGQKPETLPDTEGFKAVWISEEGVLQVSYRSDHDLGAYISSLHAAGVRVISVQATNTRLESLLLAYTHSGAHTS